MTILKLKRAETSRQCTTATLLALIAIILLTGCSKIQWLYGNVDWMLERYAVKALDLNATQLKNWQPVLGQVLQHHLNNEIPILEDYSELMARAVDGSPGGPVNVACLVQAGNMIFSRHAQLAADLTVPLLEGLDSRQIEHLANFLAVRRNHFNERYLQGEETERQRARVLRLTQRIERWTGSLDINQQARIEQFTLSLPDVAASWAVYRNRQEERLLQLLHEDADAASLHAHLLNWWIPWAAADPEFTAQWRKAEAAFIHLIDDLAMTLSDRQRQHFAVELSSLQKELTGLRGDTLRAEKERLSSFQCDQHQI